MLRILPPYGCPVHTLTDTSIQASPDCIRYIHSCLSIRPLPTQHMHCQCAVEEDGALPYCSFTVAVTSKVSSVLTKFLKARMRPSIIYMYLLLSRRGVDPGEKPDEKLPNYRRTHAKNLSVRTVPVYGVLQEQDRGTIQVFLHGRRPIEKNTKEQKPLVELEHLFPSFASTETQCRATCVCTHANLATYE